MKKLARPLQDLENLEYSDGTRYDKFEFFKNSLSSLKETSKDSDSKEISYMTESDLQVVNFDKVKEKYAKN